MLHVSDAAACGVAVPAGSFARVMKERTLIVWDEASKTEHFVRKPTFDGDPASFAFFVPTPETPQAAKSDDAIFDRLHTLVSPQQSMAGGGGGRSVAGGGAPEVTVTQTVKIGEYELVSLKASDANALGDWLKKHGYVDRPEVRAWTKTYVSRGWIINAMKYAGSKTKERSSLDVPTIRLSFHIAAPFYPYSEPPEDAKEKAEFAKRWCKSNAPECSPFTTRRSLEVFLVARKSMQGMIDGRTQGPRMARSVRVTNASLAEALGDTKGWFDTNAEKTWVVTHLEDSPQFWGGILARPTSEDLDFVSYDIPPPVPLKGVEGYVPPVAPTANPWVQQAGAKPYAPPSKKKRFAVIALALLLGLAVIFAVRSSASEAKKSDDL
jgi:hypothetical protein